MLIEHAEKLLKERALKEVGVPRNVFRASGAGRCTREQAYQMLGVPGEPLTPRRLMVFRQGRLIEKELTELLKDSIGFGFVAEAELGDHECEIDGIKVSYHIDGMFEYADENGMQCGIVEFKSINTRGFERVVAGEIDESYLAQAWVYLHGTQFPMIVFIFYRKDTSHLCEVIFDRDAKERVVTHRLGGHVLELAKDDPLLVTEVRTPFDESVGDRVREHFRQLDIMRKFPHTGIDAKGGLPSGVRAIEEETVSVQGQAKCAEMQLQYGLSYEKSGSWYKFKTGRKIAGYPCSYCAYIKTCLGAELEIKNNKPVWVIA